MIDLQKLTDEGYVVSPEYVQNLEPEERETFPLFLKAEYFRPGEKVRISVPTVEAAIALVQSKHGDARVLESLSAASDNVFEIEEVHFRSERDVSFKLKSSDILFSSEYFVDSRPTLSMYGLVLLREDRLFAIQFGAGDPPKVLNGYEIQGEVELGFGGFLGVSNRQEFINYLQNDVEANNSICGEFYISDEGFETWCLSAKAWFTQASTQELELATSFVETLVTSAPKPN